MTDDLQSFLGDVVDIFVTAPRQQATDTGQSDVNSRVRNQSRFIESNKEFYRDLTMALANYGTKGRMNGQGLPWEVRGVEGERGQLQRELEFWKENANHIVAGNDETIIGSIIDAVHEVVFAKLPGPSLEVEILAEVINKVVDLALEHSLGFFYGAPLGLIGSIVKLYIFEAWREHDMEAREAKFVELMRSSHRLRNSIESNLYNLDTMFIYYETWLTKATPADFVHFRIPFSPELLVRRDLAEAIARGISEGLSNTVGRQSIDLPWLFDFLQRNGVIADSTEIEISLRGEIGRGDIWSTELFPSDRFTPRIKIDLFQGDRIHFYVLPDAVQHGRGNVDPNAVAGLGIDPGIALFIEKITAHAVYNLRTRAWITGRKPSN